MFLQRAGGLSHFRQSMVARPGGQRGLHLIKCSHLPAFPVGYRPSGSGVYQKSGHPTHFPICSCTNATLHYRWESGLVLLVSRLIRAERWVIAVPFLQIFNMRWSCSFVVKNKPYVRQITNNNWLFCGINYSTSCRIIVIITNIGEEEEAEKKVLSVVFQMARMHTPCSTSLIRKCSKTNASDTSKQHS